jgi:hypothetical protein
MTTWPLAGVLLLVSSLAFCGWLCLFKTSMLVGWARGIYARSRVASAYPLSGIVQRHWYPTHMRCIGVFAWLSGVVFVGVLILSAARH